MISFGVSLLIWFKLSLIWITWCTRFISLSMTMIIIFYGLYLKLIPSSSRMFIIIFLLLEKILMLNIYSIDTFILQNLLVFWKLFFWNILPTVENIMARGCNLPLKCDLYGTNSDASHHIFLDCRFTRQLWHWFRSIFQI